MRVNVKIAALRFVREKCILLGISASFLSSCAKTSTHVLSNPENASSSDADFTISRQVDTDDGWILTSVDSTNADPEPEGGDPHLVQRRVTVTIDQFSVKTGMNSTEDFILYFKDNKLTRIFHEADERPLNSPVDGPLDAGEGHQSFAFGDLSSPVIVSDNFAERDAKTLGQIVGALQATLATFASDERAAALFDELGKVEVQLNGMTINVDQANLKTTLEAFERQKVSGPKFVDVLKNLPRVGAVYLRSTRPTSDGFRLADIAVDDHGITVRRHYWERAGVKAYAARLEATGDRVHLQFQIHNGKATGSPLNLDVQNNSDSDLSFLIPNAADKLTGDSELQSIKNELLNANVNYKPIIDYIDARQAFIVQERALISLQSLADMYGSPSNSEDAADAKSAEDDADGSRSSASSSRGRSAGGR